MNGLTLDAGGLIAIDQKDRRALSLIARAQELGMRITIPTTALAEVIRIPARQALISRLLRQANTNLVVHDAPDATSVGLLLATTATADIVDAHVVICARRFGQPILTIDAGDLKRIAPELQLVVA